MKFFYTVFFFLSISIYSQAAWAPLGRTLWIQPSTFQSQYNNPFLPSPYQINVVQTNAQYGITDKLTVDMTFGYGKIAKVSDYYPYAGVEYQNPTTTKHGFVDSRMGMRYKIFDEMDSKYDWMPTISVRVGGIKKGDYDRRPQSLGDGANGAETNLYFAKDFNFYGLGTFGDIGYRKYENPVPPVRLSSFSFYKNFLDDFYLILGMRDQKSLGGYLIADQKQNEPQIPDTTGSNKAKYTSIENFLIDSWITKERPDWGRKEDYRRHEISLGYRDSYGNFYTIYYSKTVSGLNTPMLETFGILANFSFYL